MTSTLPNGDRIAPGHAYMSSLGSGIQWGLGKVTLWVNGIPIETAAHDSKNARDYFHNLRFMESFPNVTHWWFRSAWTQRVRISGIQGMMDSDTVWGYMQFIDESIPSEMWTATTVDAEMSEISVPFPPNEVQLVNLPLRLALARLVAGVIADEVVRDEWLVITSLVNRNDLEKVFPISFNSKGWHLEGVVLPLREELCRLQGIK